MKQLNSIIAVLAFCFSFSCYVANAQNDVIKIDMTKCVEGDINASRLFKSIEYVRLETDEKCLMDHCASVYATQKYIIATTVFNNVFVFDRKTGKFIHKISMPNEFYHGTQSFFEKKNLFLLSNFNYCKAVNIETDSTEYRIEYPRLPNGDKCNFFPMITFLNDSIYAINKDNNSGNDPYSLVLFDKKGNILNLFPNNIQYELFGENSSFSGVFYRYDNSLFFKNCVYNDTVYKITKERIIPHIIFELGDKKPALPTRTQYVTSSNPEKKGGINVAVNSAGSWNIIVKSETDRYIFISSSINNESPTEIKMKGFIAYYDKRSHTTYRSKVGNGFINDIDHLPDFYHWTKNDNNEVVGILEAKKMLEYMKTHDKKKSWDKIKDLSSLKENDNPIVVIAKLK